MGKERRRENVSNPGKNPDKPREPRGSGPGRPADRVPSGWRPLSVEDVAAELSRAYAEARAHARDRAGAVEKARRAVDRAQQDQAVALYRMTERQ